MKNNMENSQAINEQEVLDNLYRQFGEKVFTEMQNRDESRPAEEFFNGLMFSSLEFCVKISDSIKRIEKQNQPVEAPAMPVNNIPEPPMPAPQDTGATQVIIPTEEKPRKNCPNCGASCNEDMRFCTSCGYKWPTGANQSPVITMFVPKAEDEEKALFCTNCGSKLDPDSVFCIGCGQRVEG